TVSFFLPVVDEPRHPLLGYQAFLGALCCPLYFSIFALVSLNPQGLIFLVVIVPCWLANVAYWLAVYRPLIGPRPAAGARGVLAVLLGLSVLVLPLLFHRALPGGPPFGFRAGYWLWLGSMALFALGGRALGVDRLSEARTEEIAQYWDD